jgi:hypothetical protein
MIDIQLPWLHVTNLPQFIMIYTTRDEGLSFHYTEFQEKLLLKNDFNYCTQAVSGSLLHVKMP